MIYNSSLVRWLRLKHYQFEVNLTLYMLTSTEKAIFYSILFLITSLVIIASVLYLPEHISIIARRATFYWAGEESRMRDALLTDKFVSAAATSMSDIMEGAGHTVARVADEL